MYIYNLSIKLQPEIESEWLQWMQQEHMPEVLATGMFDHSRLFRLLDPLEKDDVIYVVQYDTNELHRYQTYIDEYAQVLREKGYARFGDRFIAFRTLMQEC
ncbi:MAG TPA: DUF4286 family protein [Chitinophagaceae bacterium]|nr:DUF4286 family protein [Chitinophagaceae bacterium]HNF70958.1 DUF4286 family protein [Chitinophagaceae bacterium]